MGWGYFVVVVIIVLVCVWVEREGVCWPGSCGGGVPFFLVGEVNFGFVYFFLFLGVAFYRMYIYFGRKGVDGVCVMNVHMSMHMSVFVQTSTPPNLMCCCLNQ